MKTLEIILPLRNPTAVIEQSIASLLAQSDRSFSVLLSDNHSTQGGEFIEAAANQLRAGGIAVRRVRPPQEIGRVEHWNWAHHEATADWLKPLFAGDWLDRHYVMRLRSAISANPQCRYIFASFVLHRAGMAAQTVESWWSGGFRRAAEMEQAVLRYGMQFGPPSAAAYERSAFVALGGYPTALPICSDSLMFCAMASRFGALGLAEPLCHFNIHGARFSTNLAEKRRETFGESLTYYLMLGYGAWAGRVAFSKPSFSRMLAREARAALTGK